MFLTVRHFQDQNVLRSFWQNWPLEPNQWKLLSKVSWELKEVLDKNWKKVVKILTDVDTIRLNDTAIMISNVLKWQWFTVNIENETYLKVMNQWKLNLPESYIDWEWFEPLEVARDAICDESYLNKNLFYRFWDDLNWKYPILKKYFSEKWESLWWSLINKYGLIYDLARWNLETKDTQLILVSQSDLPLIIMELDAIKKDLEVTPENLPFKCRNYYKKSWLQEDLYDKNAIWKWNFDIPMWYVWKFDLSHFRENNFDEIIKKAQIYLQNKSKNEKK